MKKLIIILGILIILGTASYFVLLKKPQMLVSQAMIDNAITQFNKNNPGFVLKVPKDNIEITYKSGTMQPKYEVKVKNVEFSYDLESLANFFKIPDINAEDRKTLKQINVKEKADSILFYYEPTTNYLSIGEINNITISSKIPDEEVNDIEIKFSLDSVKTSEINISTFLNNKNLKIQDKYNQLMIDNPKYKISFNNFKFEIFPNKIKENEDVKKVEVTFDNINIDSNYSAELIKTIFDNVSNVDFNKFASKGAETSSNSAMLNNLKVKIITPENNDGNLNLKAFKVSASLSPSTVKENTLNFKLNYNLQGLNFKHFDPKDKDAVLLENYFNLNEMNIRFSLDSLSPEILKQYVKFVKMAEKSYENPNFFNQYLMTNMSKIQKDFLSTEPIIELNIDPLDHKIVNAKLNAKFQFVKGATFPVGKAISELYDFDKTKQKLIDLKLVTKEKLEKELNYSVYKYYKNDGKGNYKAIFEIKKEAPFFFINGEPLE